MHFTVNNDKYIATWYVRKKRTGTYDVSDRRKLEKVINGNHIVILNDVKGVNSKIQELIGLSYEQFVRSVMLAQGEFSTFLKSAKNQQSEILEMLTGTEIYSKIAEAVKKKKNDAEKKKEIVEELFNDYEHKLLPDEEIISLNGIKQNLLQTIALKEIELGKIESSIAWHKKNDDLRKECDEIMLSRNGVLEQKQSQEYKDNQCIINDYYKTSKEREAYKNLLSLEIDLCNTIKKYEDNVRSYLNLKYLLHKENDNKTSFLSRLKELSLCIDNHKDDEYISDNISLVLSLLDELSQLTTTIRVNELNVAKHNRQKNEIMTVIKSYLMDLEAVAKLKQDLEKTIEDLLIDYKPDEQHNLLEERRKLDEQRKTFSDRILQLDRVKVELEQYLSLSKYIESEKVKYNELNLLLEQKNKVLADAQSSYENKNAEYQLLKPSQISFPKFDSVLFAMSCELSLIAHCPQLKIFFKYIN